MDGGAWWAAVRGVTEGQTRLSDFTFTFHFHVLEKEMTTHSGVLAWRIPGTAEPGRLPSMGSHRVGHDWSDLAAAAAAEGYGNQHWPRHSNILAWRTSLPDREAWQATVYRVTKRCTWPKWPWVHRRKAFLSMAALPQWELNVRVGQLLGLWGPWWRQVCRDTLWCRSYGPISLFWASCSWWSEGHFDQSFSVALPIQAIRGFPCLGSLCCSAHQAHRGVPLAAVLLCRLTCQALKRAPWMGSYSVDQCVGHLMGQPLYCSAADVGERGYGDGSTPYTWLSSIVLLPCLPGFPPQ